MFEKEAEENLVEQLGFDKEFIEQEVNKLKNPNNKFMVDALIREVKFAFQKGAEFGYNKANEWHKADVPTSPINKVVLGYIKHYNSKLPCLVKWNGEWWYDARTYNDRVKLIAWKEIVLPKEIENA